MKFPPLASMVLKDLVTLRDKVEKAIDKRVGRERVSLEGKMAQLSFLARPGTIAIGKKRVGRNKRSALRQLTIPQRRITPLIRPTGF